jgi:hypothetical protein
VLSARSASILSLARETRSDTIRERNHLKPIRWQEERWRL